MLDLAVSPAGRLYIATADTVYRLTDDGTLAVAFLADGPPLTGITVDAEERLYVAVSEANQVYRVTGGKPTVIAGSGSDDVSDDIGDGGDATEATVDHPGDVAVDRSGNVYIGTFDGIRRVDADGTITTVMPAGDYHGTIGALALDAHDDLYFVDSVGNQVKVLVRPGDLANPFPWGTVIWVAVGVLALAGAGWFFLRRHRLRRTEPELAATGDESPEPPATDDEPATGDASPEPPADETSQSAEEKE